MCGSSGRLPPCLLVMQLAAVKSGATQMFGVNLGSWLVLEEYMVPSIYAMASGSPYGERQLMQVRSICGPCLP